MQTHSDLDIDNLPNRITIFRVALVPIVVTCLFFQSPNWPLPFSKETQSLMGWISAWTFILASITDYVDGHVARKRKIVTIFGSFLDPIADKFLVISTLIMLLALNRLNGPIVVILVLREIFMTSLRLLASTEGIKVPVNSLGKWKTATQMIGMPMVMCNETWNSIPFPLMGRILIYLASFLSLYSASVYTLGLVKKIKQLRKSKKQEKSQESS